MDFFFTVLVAWNSVRDESDLTLEVLDNLSGQLHSLGPVHSIPTNIKWISDEVINFAVSVRPSISKLETSSTYDLAKSTMVSVEKEKSHFKITYHGYCKS